MMYVDIWHHIEDVEAGMWWQFSPELAKNIWKYLDFTSFGSHNTLTMSA